MKPSSNRRPCMTEDVGPFSVTVSYDPKPLLEEGRVVPCEVFYTKRAKTGTDLEQLQYDFGVTASRLMQAEGLEEA